MAHGNHTWRPSLRRPPLWQRATIVALRPDESLAWRGRSLWVRAGPPFLTPTCSLEPPLVWRPIELAYLTNIVLARRRLVIPAASVELHADFRRDVKAEHPFVPMCLPASVPALP